MSTGTFCTSVCTSVKKSSGNGKNLCNITNDEVSKQESQVIMNEIINEAKSKVIRV